jgi:hypothetical protein
MASKLVLEPLVVVVVVARVLELAAVVSLLPSDDESKRTVEVQPVLVVVVGLVLLLHLLLPHLLMQLSLTSLPLL